ncbi:uncharacterized protein LOC129728679 [Wyeomyia smithii]|uniref:uncharacterized protein LOC129728679 n=1 Tax=Wyeomyia smithii TaxID=174621 RepID=UPI002467DC31|nr:uncharacterized protein LOC129728679 [Wyeomyia smithii]
MPKIGKKNGSSDLQSGSDTGNNGSDVKSHDATDPSGAANADTSVQNQCIQRHSSEHQQQPPQKSFHAAVSVSSASVASSSAQSSMRRKMELQLRKLEEAKAIEQRFLDMKFAILDKFENDTSSVIDDIPSIADKVSQIENWIDDTNKVGNEDPGLQLEVINTTTPKQTLPVNSVHFPRGNQTRDHFIPGYGSTPNRQPIIQPPIVSRVNRSTNANNIEDETVCILNRSQLAARHAVSKDLPEFSGKLEDWPLFFAMFNTSTQMCGFSAEENMLRLRKCLKGAALNAVSCELLHPSNVASVISTLKMLYGRPERIIQALILKIEELPSLDTDDFDTVIQFALGVKNLCATIQACEIPDFVYNVALRSKLVERLPPWLKYKWAEATEGSVMPSLQDFNAWLYAVAERLNSVKPIRSSEQKGTDRKLGFRAKKENFLNVHVQTDKHTEIGKPQPSKHQEFPKACGVCKGTCSSLEKCKRFSEFGYDSRWATIKELKLCRKCLNRHYTSCNRKKPCGIDGCTFLHHPLLHCNKKVVIPPSSVADKSIEESERSCNVHQQRTSDVLFRFVPVILHGPSKAIQTYAFIDDGSELTLLEKGLADELGVSGKSSPLCLKWTGDTRRLERTSQKVDLEIAGTSKYAKRFKLTNVRTVEKLQLRPQTMLIDELQNRFPHLKGLPIESYRNTSPRILIGVDHAKLGHVTNSREGKPSEPIGIKTCLGWCVYGSLISNGSDSCSFNNHQLDGCQCNHDCDNVLHNEMKNYFSLDSMGVVKSGNFILSTEDERAQKLLKMLTCWKGGKYESGLLWKYDNPRLPASREMALKRWRCLERRMENDPKLSDVLNAKIADYVSQGYIRRLTNEELNTQHSRIWYLPVFPVVNPNKPLKTRLVWDAAAKAFGVSLNSVLLKGPDLLTSLLGVLIQFREYRVAVCGDLREMYHQIQMREEDQQCQRFFWGREEHSAEPYVYVMQVLTFGACCSPSTAQYVKNEHAKRYEQKSPAAFRAITEQHYVDDMLVSVETEKEATELVGEVKRIHAEGGFEMRNWLSNSEEVLANLTDKPTAEKNLDVCDGAPTEKILGMWWNTKKDCFTFKLSNKCQDEFLSGFRRPTKREVLRTLMLMFDPLGLIAHFMMFLKVLLQEIWRSGINWDDCVCDAEFQKWLMWIDELPKLKLVEIPRCYRNITSISAEIQLHAFVDASENGFAAVVYLRYTEGSTIECALIGAKTRVAPLRYLSIPRSELQAAVIGTRLTNNVLKALNVKVSRRYFYTDSRDVCCWLNSDHRRYNSYVACKVSEILESTEPAEWHWISTKYNVADEGTKWKGKPDLSATSRWFHGPAFLWKPETEWPITSRQYGPTDEELRPHLMVHTLALQPAINAYKFSSWTTLLRKVSSLYRCALNWKRRVKKIQLISGSLTRGEYTLAECYLYRTAQEDVFADEIAIFMNNSGAQTTKPLPKCSSLYRLCAYLDESNVLRIRGRTAACKYIDAGAVDPVILPRRHHITHLIIADFHQRFHHQNHETVLNELRQIYYIPRLKSIFKKVRSECQQCKNERAKPRPPLMADLPVGRLAAYCRPFTHTGVDYFGPITISLGRRVEKRWVVLATCLTTRAIHLQIAFTLSTDSCIMALRNIFGRRGTPAVIYSDCGTNFQGASKEFKTAMENVDHDRLVKEFTSAHTEWKFNPPASPHMGGAWERLIRTVKINLNNVLASRVTSAEVLENALTEVENIVNSRPLTDIPLENDFSPVLTPNHFLIQSSNGLKPLVPLDNSPVALYNNYKTSQVLANMFWKQWLRDYLPTITRRTKWFAAVEPIKVNDLVVVVDPKLPRNCWPKGRVIAAQTGLDGQVRRATVRTGYGGIYERPAVKLAVLDVGVGNNAPSAEPAHSGGSVQHSLYVDFAFTPLTYRKDRHTQSASEWTYMPDRRFFDHAHCSSRGSS